MSSTNSFRFKIVKMAAFAFSLFNANYECCKITFSVDILHSFTGLLSLLIPSHRITAFFFSLCLEINDEGVFVSIETKIRFTALASFFTACTARMYLLYRSNVSAIEHQLYPLNCPQTLVVFD